MTKLVWNKDVPKYEYGVDRGVFYPQVAPNTYKNGVVWNGLINVEESSVGGDSEGFHFDGVKYLQTVNPRNYQASLSAFSSPQGFQQAIGEHPVVSGFILTRQSRSQFGFSYRTFIGNEGYKIHLVYNAFALEKRRQYSTLTNDISAEVQEWRIDAVPPLLQNHRPSAHFVIDSTKIDSKALENLEYIIYGSQGETARLPSIDELYKYIVNWNPFVINAQVIPGLAEIDPGGADLTPSAIPGFYLSLPISRLIKSSRDGFYELE